MQLKNVKNDNLYIQLSRLRAIRKCVSVYMRISECITCVKQLTTRKKVWSYKGHEGTFIIFNFELGQLGTGVREWWHSCPLPPRCCRLCGQRWFLPWEVSRLLPVPRGLCYCAAVRFTSTSMLIIFSTGFLCRWFWWTVRPLPWWKQRSAILVFEIVDLNPISYVSQWTA